MIYQVTYKAKNKTFYSDLEAKHYQDVLNFFDKVIGAEVQEIREYVHEELKDINFTSFNSTKALVKIENTTGQKQEIKIPLLKETAKEDYILTYIKSNFTINNQKPIKAIIKQF